jgi:hypothetical protein
VAAGAEVCRVVAGRILLAEIALDPADAALMRLGDKVVARARVLGALEPRGRVTSISSQVELDATGASTLRARATLRGRDPVAVVDLPATVEIAAAQTSLLGSVFRAFATWVRLRVWPAISG